MGHKKANTFQFNWSATSPVPFSPNTALSGVITGAMASTNVIYSNIQDLTNTDNQGLEFSWTGTPTGTIALFASVGGVSFFAVTPSPALTQPAGSATGFITALNQFPYRYFYIQYTNVSGTGVLTALIQSKDLN